jgi:AraC family transcriptional regulator
MSITLTEPSAPSAFSEWAYAFAHGEPRGGSASRWLPPGLQTWRLYGVQAYISAHMLDPIRPTDVANAAGLSRMYFAAQFRVKMKVRPHEYLMRQRISRAQTLLKEPQAVIADTAVSVGFKNRAHFTTVFHRYSGVTSHRWRLS